MCISPLVVWKDYGNTDSKFMWYLYKQIMNFGNVNNAIEHMNIYSLTYGRQLLSF